MSSVVAPAVSAVTQGHSNLRERARAEQGLNVGSTPKYCKSTVPPSQPCELIGLSTDISARSIGDPPWDCKEPRAARCAPGVCAPAII